jgi:hypothetical protein
VETSTIKNLNVTLSPYWIFLFKILKRKLYKTATEIIMKPKNTVIRINPAAIAACNNIVE